CLPPNHDAHSSAPARYTTYRAGLGRQRAYRSAFAAARSAVASVACNRDAYRGVAATTTLLPTAARSSLTSHGRGPFRVDCPHATRRAPSPLMIHVVSTCTGAGGQPVAPAQNLTST